MSDVRKILLRFTTIEAHRLEVKPKRNNLVCNVFSSDGTAVGSSKRGFYGFWENIPFFYNRREKLISEQLIGARLQRQSINQSTHTANRCTCKNEPI